MSESNNPDRSSSPESEEQMQRTASRWIVWLQELRESGHLKDIGFQALGTAFVAGPNGEVGSANTSLKDKGPICGYIVVEADNLAQAVELARSCPILETGGSVEIRPIAPVDMTWN